MNIIFGRWRKIITLGVAGLVIGCPVMAAGPTQATMHLSDAVENAWRIHPSAAAVKAKLNEAQAQREIAARMTPEPGRVTLGTRTDRLNNNVGQREYEIEFETSLWLRGQKAAHLQEADRKADKITAQNAAARLELAGEVREVWWKLAAAQNARALAAKRLENSTALLADVTRRYKAGDLSRIDDNLARGEQQDAQGALIEAEIAQAEAEQDYRILTGYMAPPILPGEALAAMKLQENDRIALVDSHPRVAAVLAEIEDIRAQVRVLDKSRRSAPEISVGLVRERGDFHESYANSMGVKLTIPLSSGPQLRREQFALQSENDQATAEMARVRSQVNLQIERTSAALRSAQRTLAIAQERVKLTSDSLGLTEKAFELGEIDLATLIRLRSAAFDATSFLEQQRIVNAASVSRLNQALGVLP